jgi:hypothetical protein
MLSCRSRDVTIGIPPVSKGEAAPRRERKLLDRSAPVGLAGRASIVDGIGSGFLATLPTVLFHLTISGPVHGCRLLQWAQISSAQCLQS